MSRSVRIALVVGVAGLAAVAVWWFTRETSAGRPARAQAGPGPTATRGLDVAAFRVQLATRRERAQELQHRRAAAPPSPPGERTPGPKLAGMMLAPECILGPADLCASIADSVDACDAGDATACLAVGQYLQDAPPRPLIAVSFFLYACRHGEDEGCKRMAELKAPPTTPPAPCVDDPLACAWQGIRTKDDGRLDQACAAGVADACAKMLEHTEDQPARHRGYLEAACQLGNPMTCVELGRRLSPDCREDCYPPDPAAAIAASTIACEVGFTEACGRLPAP